MKRSEVTSGPIRALASRIPVSLRRFCELVPIFETHSGDLLDLFENSDDA